MALFKAVVYGDNTGLSTIRSSSASDVSTAIDFIWDTKDFNVGDIDETLDIGNFIRWKGIDVGAKGGSVTAYYSTDSGSTWNLIGTLTLDSDYPDDDDPQIFYFDVLSSKIRFRFRNNVAGETLALKQYVLNYNLRGPRK